MSAARTDLYCPARKRECEASFAEAWESMFVILRKLMPAPGYYGALRAPYPATPPPLSKERKRWGSAGRACSEMSGGKPTPLSNRVRSCALQLRSGPAKPSPKLRVGGDGSAMGDDSSMLIAEPRDNRPLNCGRGKEVKDETVGSDPLSRYRDRRV